MDTECHRLLKLIPKKKDNNIHIAYNQYHGDDAKTQGIRTWCVHQMETFSV